MIDLLEIDKQNPYLVVVELQNPTQHRRGVVVDFEYPDECEDVDEPCIMIREFNRTSNYLTELKQSEIKSIKILQKAKPRW